jgi:hypothetical protein
LKNSLKGLMACSREFARRALCLSREFNDEKDKSQVMDEFLTMVSRRIYSPHKKVIFRHLTKRLSAI